MGELEEDSGTGLSVEERLYALESGVAVLVGIVRALVLDVGVVTNGLTVMAEGREGAEVVRQAKNVAADLGALVQKMNEMWPSA